MVVWMADEPTGQEPQGGTRDYEAEIKSLRNEAAGYRVDRNELRKQVEDLIAEVKGFKDKDKSDMERANERVAERDKKIADLEREAAEKDLRATVVAEAAKLNIVDPDAAYRLLDKADIDSADLKGVTKALTSLAKERPYLVKEAPEPPTPGPGGRPLGDAKPSTDEMWASLLKRGAPKS